MVSHSEHLRASRADAMTSSCDRHWTRPSEISRSRLLATSAHSFSKSPVGSSSRLSNSTSASSARDRRGKASAWVARCLTWGLICCLALSLIGNGERPAGRGSQRHHSRRLGASTHDQSYQNCPTGQRGRTLHLGLTQPLSDSRGVARLRRLRGHKASFARNPSAGGRVDMLPNLALAPAPALAPALAPPCRIGGESRSKSTSKKPSARCSLPDRLPRRILASALRQCNGVGCERRAAGRRIPIAPSAQSSRAPNLARSSERALGRIARRHRNLPNQAQITDEGPHLPRTAPPRRQPATWSCVRRFT